MGLDAPWHWIILAVVVAALFGYKRLPDMTRSVARSLRIFKTEMKGMSQDDAARGTSATGETPNVVPTDSPYGANPYASTPAPVPPASVPPTVAPPAVASTPPAPPSTD